MYFLQKKIVLILPSSYLFIILMYSEKTVRKRPA